MPLEYGAILGLHWLWIPIIAVAWALPLLFWKRRLGYAAFWCLALAVAVAALWRSDWDGMSQAALAFRTRRDGHLSYNTLGAQSGRGGLSLAWASGVDRRPENFLDWPGSPEFRLSRQVFDEIDRATFAYPDPGKPGATVRYKGFLATFDNRPDNPAQPVVQKHFWAFVVPDWFAIGVLSITPLVWAYKTVSNKERYRRKHNLCLKCGYALQGLPDPIVCPECGTAKAEPVLAL
jgi:hypothetical protein